jgi:hypothetical protein
MSGVMTGIGILKCFDLSGTEVWMRDIQKEYGRFGLNWGNASSPLLFDNSLFVPVLHGMRTDDPSYLLRIDAKTRQDALAGGTADHCDSGVSRRLHNTGSTASGQLGRDYSERRRLHHWTRPSHRQGIVAGLWVETRDNNPNYRIVNSPLVSEGIGLCRKPGQTLPRGARRGAR